MTGSAAEPILTEQRGAVLIVTMNRPQAHNAISRAMSDALCAAWDLIDRDDTIHVAIITGAGNSFCAGGDLKEMNAEQTEPDERPFVERMSFMLEATLRDRRLRKPLIAAIEGAAFAGGMEMLQATDIRVTGESAKFALPEVTLGLFPISGSTTRLARQIPFALAMELLLTGRVMGAREARDAGFVGSVVPDGEALAHALQIAERIARNGPLAVQAIKRSVWETSGLPEAESLAREMVLGRGIWDSEDAKEGIRAFAEKRPPEFKGR